MTTLNTAKQLGATALVFGALAVFSFSASAMLTDHDIEGGGANVDFTATAQPTPRDQTEVLYLTYDLPKDGAAVSNSTASAESPADSVGRSADIYQRLP